MKGLRCSFLSRTSVSQTAIDGFSVEEMVQALDEERASSKRLAYVTGPQSSQAFSASNILVSRSASIIRASRLRSTDAAQWEREMRGGGIGCDWTSR